MISLLEDTTQEWLFAVEHWTNYWCEVFKYIVITVVCNLLCIPYSDLLLLFCCSIPILFFQILILETTSNKNCHMKGSNEVLITCQGSGQAIVPQFMAILRFLLIPFSHFVLIAWIFQTFLLRKQFLGFITYVILCYWFVRLSWLFWAFY